MRLWVPRVPLKRLRVSLERTLCAHKVRTWLPDRSLMSQIVLGANLANLGPHPLGPTLWNSGVQYAAKHMRISCWDPFGIVSD